MSVEQRPPKKRFSIGQWLCVAVVVIVGLMALSPVVMKCSKKSSLIEAMSNAKQIWFLLMDFDQDFGAFPNDETARGKAELNSYTGEYANDYLGQLLAGGYTKSEEVFYAKAGSLNQHRPDDDISTKSKTLEEGECGFAYIKGLGMSSHQEAPILLTAMYGDGLKFNTKVYKGKAVVLRVDGAVKLYRLDENHHAVIHQAKGEMLFTGGSDSASGKDGFNSENLCYAKHPYEYKEPLKSSHKLIIAGFIVIIVVGLSVMIKRGKTRRSSLIA